MSHMVQLPGFVHPIDVSDENVLTWLITWPGIRSLPPNHPAVCVRAKYLLHLAKTTHSPVTAPQGQFQRTSHPTIHQAQSSGQSVGQQPQASFTATVNWVLKTDFNQMGGRLSRFFHFGIT